MERINAVERLVSRYGTTMHELRIRLEGFEGDAVDEANVRKVVRRAAGEGRISVERLLNPDTGRVCSVLYPRS